MSNTFLQAEWRKLIMMNYAVDSKQLAPYLPYRTEMDLWNNTCYVSLVGFMFLNTSVRGFKIPFHINFEEVNLRFYVRFKEKNEWRRGVVFIKEIVPKSALTFIANTIYKEHYETLPMAHHWLSYDQKLSVEYRWKKFNKWNSMLVNASSLALDIKEGSEQEFITEHFWGYTKIKDNVTSEYGVEHPRWQVYPAIDYLLDVNFEDNYGPAFKFLNQETPKSVFLAEGSKVKVKEGRKISIFD